MSENLSSRLKEYLPQQIIEPLIDAGNKAENLDQRLFLVGGMVRDLLLNRINLDMDLVLEGDAIKLAQALAENSKARLKIHPRFGTAKLSFADFSLDLASARLESYNQPGALPTVQPGTITDDLHRRDFSINAMAISLVPRDFGKIIDLHNGRADINNRLIRILHPNSFIDDATRILRAIRYEQRLNFTLEASTTELIRRDASMLNTISGDRLRHELELILREEYPELILKQAKKLGVLNKLHPSLKGNGWLSERFSQSRLLFKQLSPVLLYLCLLTYNMNDNEKEQFISRLNFPKKPSQSIRQTSQLKAQLQHMTEPKQKPSDIYQLLHSYTIQSIQANMLAQESNTIRSNLHLYLTRLRYVKPLLTGDDLKDMGISAGPQLGKVMHSLYEAKLNGEVKTRDDEKSLVHNWQRNS